VNLATDFPRMSSSAALRVRACLDVGCPCNHDTAILTRRRVNAAVTIHLQCQRCGKSLSGALPRADHYFFQGYPEWNAELQEKYWEGQKKEFEDKRPQRRQDYQAFLSTPEWRTLRHKVLQRAQFPCECCLSDGAVEVHHDGYSDGWLPPAWKLRAVCRSCHERLHEATQCEAKIG
jgi:hypothetical protein